MPADPAAIAVEHDPQRSRFEARVNGLLSVADYHLRDGVMMMTHTEVPPALQGRGIAAELIRAALDHAEAQGLKIDPRCSYVRRYMQRHPETHKLLAE